MNRKIPIILISLGLGFTASVLINSALTDKQEPRPTTTVFVPIQEKGLAVVPSAQPEQTMTPGVIYTDPSDSTHAISVGGGGRPTPTSTNTGPGRLTTKSPSPTPSN